MILYEKDYDGESIYDLDRDMFEAFDKDYNPKMKDVPQDEHGFHKGTFRVKIEWIPD